MAKYSSILYSIRKKFHEVKERFDSEVYTPMFSYNCNVAYLAGYDDAVKDAERIIFEQQDKDQTYYEHMQRTMWYPGSKSPNDLKENNRGDYILIVKTRYDDAPDGVKKDGVYIITDYWTGTEFMDVNSTDMFDVLYWCKLKWIRLALPMDIHGKREEMYLK